MPYIKLTNRNNDSSVIELIPDTNSRFEVEDKAWVIGTETLRMCLAGQPVVTDPKDMIVRSSSGKLVVVSAATELEVYLPGDTEPLALMVQGDDGQGDMTYVYYGPFIPPRYQSQLDIIIRPVTPGVKIKKLTLQGVTEVVQWYSGGYDGFSGYGLGIDILQVPDHEPPNTSNYDYIISQFSPYFKQDISNWCVSNVTSTPLPYSELSGSDYEEASDEDKAIIDAFLARLPQWGTCPQETREPTIVIPESAMIMRGAAYLGAGQVLISSKSPLKVVFNDTYVPRATGFENYGVMTYQYWIDAPDFLKEVHQNVYVWHEDGVSKIDSIHVTTLYEVVKWYDNGYVSVGFEGLGMGDSLVKLPTVAPPLTDKLSYIGGTYFNDVSITEWDVSGVKDMSGFLYLSSYFTQDLSKMCVGTIFTRPYQFWHPFTDLNSPDILAREPRWGTCPLVPNYVRPWPPVNGDDIVGEYRHVQLESGERVRLGYLTKFTQDYYRSNVFISVSDGTESALGIISSNGISWGVDTEDLPTFFTQGSTTGINEASEYGVSELDSWISYGLMITSRTETPVHVEIFTNNTSTYRVAAQKITPVVSGPGSVLTTTFTPDDDVVLLYGYEPSKQADAFSTVLSYKITTGGVVTNGEISTSTMESIGIVFNGDPEEELGFLDELELAAENYPLVGLTPSQAIDMETYLGHYVAVIPISNKFGQETTFEITIAGDSPFVFNLVKPFT